MRNAIRSACLRRRFPLVPAAVLALLFAAPAALPQDIPAPVQLPGEHSTISLQGTPSSIRDDHLADFIASQIPKDSEGKPQVRDVKIMVNSCYGGGILDDMQRIFGPGGACEGVPWIGGAASGPSDLAWGWSDGVVADPDNEGKELGSTWTSALAGPQRSPTDPNPGSIRSGGGGSVRTDLESARDNDAAGPNHANREQPVIASGNGGHAIGWRGDGAKHEAVVFGGLQTNQRHHNNIENVAGALEQAWAGQPHNIQKIDGGTEADLKNAIRDACQRLDKDTQLVIYLDDHGNTEFDFIEYLHATMGLVPPLMVEPGLPLMVHYDLHHGWIEGLAGMASQGEPVEPQLWISVIEPVPAEALAILMNGMILHLDPGLVLHGYTELPIAPWTMIQPGPNHLVIEVMPGAPFMVLIDHLELSSGPINELELEPQTRVDDWQLFDR